MKYRNLRFLLFGFLITFIPAFLYLFFFCEKTKPVAPNPAPTIKKAKQKFECPFLEEK